MSPNNFLKFLTFSMHSNKSRNKMATNDGQIKLTITDTYMIFQCEYLKCNKNLRCWIMQAVPE